MDAQVEINHREQYDSDREIQIIRICNTQGTFFTIVLYNPTTVKYNYSDLTFENLIDAHEAFKKIMEKIES